MGWISCGIALPLKLPKNNDSKHVLVYNIENGDQAVAWYNYDEEIWRISHSSTHNDSISVTHWAPIIEPPKQ